MRMRKTSIFTAIAAIVGLAVVISTPTPSLVALAARTSVLIMGGSGDPLTTEKDGVEFVERYLGNAVGNFVQPASGLSETGIPDGGVQGYRPVAVITPAQFYPDSSLTFDESVAEGRVNLQNCMTGPMVSCDYNSDVGGSTVPSLEDTFVVFGYSQSATIATLEKRRLSAEFGPGEGPPVSFVLIANGNRPNGGFLARGPLGFSIPKGFTFGGVTFSGPTPTDTQYSTVDFAIQYDFWADQPVNPLNLLAWVNAQMGQEQLHPHYPDRSLEESGVIDQGRYGDTSYYLAATRLLPLVSPLTQIPVIGEALAEALDAPLRVIIESAYDRTTSPGKPTSWNVFYGPNPIKFAIDLAVAIPTGIDNGFEKLYGVRPFRTVRPGPYGVGGPDVTWLNPADPTDPAEPSTELTAAQTAPTVQTAAVETSRPEQRRRSLASVDSDRTDRALEERQERARARAINAEAGEPASETSEPVSSPVSEDDPDTEPADDREASEVSDGENSRPRAKASTGAGSRATR